MHIGQTNGSLHYAKGSKHKRSEASSGTTRTQASVRPSSSASDEHTQRIASGPGFTSSTSPRSISTNTSVSVLGFNDGNAWPVFTGPRVLRSKVWWPARSGICIKQSITIAKRSEQRQRVLVLPIHKIYKMHHQCASE